MTAPILTSGFFTNNTVILFFDKALDTSIPTPLSSFIFNAGKVIPLSYIYVDNSTIKVTLTSTLAANDKLFFSYEPPTPANLGLQAPTPAGSSSRLAIIARLPRIPVFELTNGMAKEENKANYNLGLSYPNTANTSNPQNATVDDYVLTYGEKEAIQISNFDNASATSANHLRIMRAIEDANALIDSYIRQAGKAGKLLISSNRRRTSLIIARYYLDVVNRRKDVTDDYTNAIKELDILADPTRGNVDPQDPSLAMNNGGIMRSWRIPQRVNPISGKGLSGFWTDPAYDKPNDERTGKQELDNLSVDNRKKEGYNVNIVPNDGGGISINGD